MRYRVGDDVEIRGKVRVVHDRPASWKNTPPDLKILEIATAPDTRTYVAVGMLRGTTVRWAGAPGYDSGIRYNVRFVENGHALLLADDGAYCSAPVSQLERVDA